MRGWSGHWWYGGDTPHLGFLYMSWQLSPVSLQLTEQARLVKTVKVQLG
jgi:hypothetical protein